MGKGWWINGRTGESIEVFEHAGEVVNHPERFGYTSGDLLIQNFNPSDAESRRELLKDVMLRGWIRVRFTGGRASRRVVELWAYTNRARDALDMWLTETGAWDNEQVEVHELRPPGRSWTKPVKDIKYTYEPVESCQRASDPEEATGWQVTFRGVDEGLLPNLIELLEEEIENHQEYSGRFWFDDDHCLVWECVNASPATGVPMTDTYRNTAHRNVLIDAIAIAVAGDPDRTTDLPRPTRLSEASLGRVYQHWLNGGFGIVSADRGERTEGENAEWRKLLRQRIRASGHGFVPLEGVWIETDQETGEERKVTEVSYLVPASEGVDKLKELLLNWGTIDGNNPQEAVSLVHPGGPVEFIDPGSGAVLDSLEEFHPDKVSQVYSRLTRRPGKPVKDRPPTAGRTEPSKATTFVFESWDFVRPPKSWPEAAMRAHEGEIKFISEARNT
jgi:hypothetical protein